MLTVVPGCPWDTVDAGSVCFVRRTKRGNSAEFEYFRSGTIQPIALDKTDANALVEALSAGATSPTGGADRSQERRAT